VLHVSTRNLKFHSINALCRPSNSYWSCKWNLWIIFAVFLSLLNLNHCALQFAFHPTQRCQSVNFFTSTLVSSKHSSRKFLVIIFCFKETYLFTFCCCAVVLLQVLNYFQWLFLFRSLVITCTLDLLSLSLKVTSESLYPKDSKILIHRRVCL
jgi:hypothetical protein